MSNLELESSRGSRAKTKIDLAYQILAKFENHFRTVMETGKLASKQLDELRKK